MKAGDILRHHSIHYKGGYKDYKLIKGNERLHTVSFTLTCLNGKPVENNSYHNLTKDWWQNTINNSRGRWELIETKRGLNLVII